MAAFGMIVALLPFVLYVMESRPGRAIGRAIEGYCELVESWLNRPRSAPLRMVSERPALAWRSDPPTAGGFYWLRYHPSERPSVVEAFEGPNGQFKYLLAGVMHDHNADWVADWWPHAQWAGPIVLPTAERES